jgi:hypothetical protein
MIMFVLVVVVGSSRQLRPVRCCYALHTYQYSIKVIMIVRLWQEAGVEFLLLAS